MRYEKAKDLKESDFKRLCGVKKETFVTMCARGQRSLESGNERQKVGIIGRRSSITDTWLLAGISHNVSFGTGFRDSRIKCFADYSENRRHFNQVREVFTAGQKTLVGGKRADLYDC